MRAVARVLAPLGLMLLTGCALRPTRPPGDVASWYGSWHHGRPSASGEPYDMYAMTAAHPSLPLGTCVEVVNLNNGRHVFVRINDRGPYVAGRTIDLSYRAAQELRMVADGIAPVQIIHAKAEQCVRPTCEMTSPEAAATMPEAVKECWTSSRSSGLL